MGSSVRKPKLDQQTIEHIQNMSDLSVTDIEEWYHDFRSRCSRKDSDFLSLHDFIQTYNSVYRGRAGAFAEHVFRTFDKDRNGRVDFLEFMRGLDVTEGKCLRKKLQWAFDMYDIDGNGFVSKEEMKHLFLDWFRMTGVVPARKEDSPNDLTESIFKKTDLNHDSLISWDEFSCYAEKDPFLVDLLQCHPNIGQESEFE